MRKIYLLASIASAALLPTTLQAAPFMVKQVSHPFRLMAMSSYLEPGYYCQEAMRDYGNLKMRVSCFGASGVTDLTIDSEYNCSGGTFPAGPDTIYCDGAFHSLDGPGIYHLHLNSPGDDVPFTLTFGDESDPDSEPVPPKFHINAIKISYNHCSMTYHFDELPDHSVRAQEELGKIYICEGPDATEFTEIPVDTTAAKSKLSHGNRART